jgi:hypothetical protein
MGLRALVKTYPFWINLDQSGSIWINLDQTGSITIPYHLRAPSGRLTYDANLFSRDICVACFGNPPADNCFA